MAQHRAGSARAARPREPANLEGDVFRPPCRPKPRAGAGVQAAMHRSSWRRPLPLRPIGVARARPRGAAPAGLVLASAIAAAFAIALAAWLPLLAQFGAVVVGDRPQFHCTSGPPTVPASLVALVAAPALIALVAGLAVQRRWWRGLAALTLGLGLALLAALGCAANPHDRASHEEAVILDAAPILGVAVAIMVGLVVAYVGMATRRTRAGAGRWWRAGLVALALAVLAAGPSALAARAASAPHDLPIQRTCF